MRKNILLIVLVAAIFVFVGAMHNSTKAADDPVEVIRNAKTPVHLHSLAGGTICDPPYSDSLVHELPSMTNTWWHSIYPHDIFCHEWKVDSVRDNGIPGLNPSDKLRLYYNEDPEKWVWVHVEEVTKTLILTKEPDHLDTMYVEYTGGYDSLMNPETDPDYHPVCTWWHEIWPEYSRIYHLSSWIDDPSNPDGMLSCCDTIDLTEWWHVIGLDSLSTGLWLTIEDQDGEGANRILKFSGSAYPDSFPWVRQNPVCTWWHEEEPDFCNWWHIDSWVDNGNGYLDPCDIIDFVTWWHVEDVAIDILVQSIPDPTVPTMTQWGVIVLAALIVASAIFIMLRRRRATVPA